MSEMPRTMRAWRLHGHGGMEMLSLDEVPVPAPGPGEVLYRVAAAGLNNTDVNTRLGWYAKGVRGGTEEGATADGQAGGWDGALDFPRIQGADGCGRIVAVGEGGDASRIGQRIVVRTMQALGPRRVAASKGAPLGPTDTWTYGSECDGAFAEYAIAFEEEAIPAPEGWSDVEAASLPCAWSTAEGMIQRAGLGEGRVLVTGASGGVGSAAVQLLKRRGAEVVAMVGGDKADAVRALGADATLDRDEPLGSEAFDAVVDLVAGPRFADMLEAIRRGGRYVTSGAIAGPIVELDVRTLYLRDLTLYGSTFQPPSILPDVVRYAEAGEVRPSVSATWPFEALKEAQAAFIRKRHVGKIVLEVGERSAG